MSTHYTRLDCAEYRAPFPTVSRDVTRYRSAAEICAAINAAAADAPEFSDACYAPGAADWHGPTRGASFAHFLYCIDGARGSYSVSNTRENLLTLARKVNTIRAAFDGKPRRAPAAKRAPTSAPHVAARALMADGNARDAIQLAENSGAVFFGAAAIGAPGVPYMGCETVEFFGQSFTIGRAIKTGRFIVLHTSTALSVSGSAHRDGFTTHSAALDWIETESACDAWREKFHTALHGRSEFDQYSARALYFADDAEPVESIQTAPDDIAQPEPAAVESAPDAPMDPAAVDRAPDPAPAARALPLLPVLVSNALERIESGESLLSAAAWEWASANHYTRAFVDDWLIDQNHSVRHLIGSPEARFRALVDMVHSDADPAAVYGWKRAPVDTAPAAPEPAAAPVDSAPLDAPAADPAPVDDDTMRAAPIDPAPTPGYAFPGHALPATHSDAAEPAPADRMAAAKFARQSEILEKLIRCDGQVMTRRAFLHSKIRDGLRLTVEQHDRIAPMSRMATFRASNEEQRAHDRRILAAGKKDVFFIGGFEITKTEFDYAAEILASMAPAADPAPVPGDSDPVPVNSADVDAVEVARLVAKFRQFADERRRTGDTLAAAIRVESAEARYRADSLTAPNAFRDAPGAGHEAAKAHDTRRAAEYRAAAAELDRLADAMPADDAAPVATHSAPIAEPVALATHSAPVDDGGFSRRVDTAAAYISGGRRTSRTFDSCFEMWDGDAVAVALLRRAEKRPGTRLAANLSRYLARHHVEAAADRQPTGLSLAEWSRALIKAREPLPETAPVPADTAPDDDTTPAPLDGLDVIETADAETLAEFDRLSRAPGVAPTATDARPIPSGPVLRIPAGDLRARIPARFAPAYLLTA